VGYVLRNCDYAIAWINGELRIIKNATVVVEDGLIMGIDKNVEARGFDVIDCSGHVLMPGLVNAHTHTAMSLLRGFFDDAELPLWLSKMWSVERELTPHIVAKASELSIMEMVMTGTTAFIDMYYYPEATAEVILRYGLRAALGPTFIDMMRDPAGVEKELRNFVSEFGSSRLIKPIINVHSVYAVSRDTLLRIKELSDELGLPIHMHVSETRDEVYEVKRRYGVFPVEYLGQLGLVSDKLQLVHLGWVTNWELGIIARAGAKVIHAPTSNMKLATAGHFPMRELMEMGVIVGLGTDGPASNNSLDMFREMKMAVLLQRHSYWDVSIKAYHAFKAATINGYSLLGLRGGCLDSGCVADVVLLDSRNPRLQPLRMDNLLSNIVYSADGSVVDLVLVNGKIVYERARDYDRFRERAVRLGEELSDFIQRFIS